MYSVEGFISFAMDVAIENETILLQSRGDVQIVYTNGKGSRRIMLFVFMPWVLKMNPWHKDDENCLTWQ